MGALEIRLLGGFHVDVAGRPVPERVWRRSRARALIAMLALAPGHRLHREHVQAQLWPGLDQDAAGANLRKALHFARRATDPGHLTLAGEMLSLEADPLWVDVDTLAAAQERGDLEGAAALYAGDLLPEDSYEPWTQAPREALRRRHHRLLADWAEQLEARGEIEPALSALERLAPLEPLDEEVHGRLMRLQARAGRRHLALRTYEALAERLRNELGVEPGPDLIRLHEAIRSGQLPGGTSSEAPAPPATAPPRLEEVRLVTVVFADAARGAGDPERERAAAAATVADMIRVLEAWGGSAEPLPDGSVVAVFGFPRLHEDDASRALRAALELLGQLPGPVRIGVATGEALAAGGGGTPAGSLAGGVLATASRLREAAAPGTVLASERSCRAGGGAFELGPMAEIATAAGEVRARQVLGARPEVESPVRLRTRLYGRDSELAGVLDLFADVASTGRARLALLIGAAGVGKTRLAREVLAAAAARQPHSRLLRGRCLAAGPGGSYWALAAVLRQACDINLSEPADAVRAKLERSVSSSMAGLPAEDVRATIQALAVGAAIPLPGNPLERLDPEAVGAEMGLAWPRFLTALAAAGPTLLLIEDLHWADQQLLDMLERIVARSSGPILVLATSRPELLETDPAFGRGVGDDLVTVSLRPLSREQSGSLLDSLLSKRRLAPSLRELVLERAEGNPLFLEELTLHLLDGVSELLPDTLQLLLAARLDSLAAPERHVLQEAAVIGRAFWEVPLEQALEGQSVGPQLDTLERRGFIVRRPASSLSGQAEFWFRHALIHDAAYESMPRGRRARAHAAVAAWLEQVAAERRAEMAELLAHHLARAAAPEVADLAWPDPSDRERVRSRAFEQLLAAGGAALRRYAVTEAISTHRRALDLASTPGERIRAMEAIGDDNAALYHGAELALAYGQALELARAGRGRGRDVARLCRKLAWAMAWNPGAFAVSPDPAEVEALIGQGLAASDDEVNRAWLLLVDGTCARLYRGAEPFGQGTRHDTRPIEARLESVRRSLQTGEALGLGDLVSAARRSLGMLAGLSGRYGEMVEMAEREVAELAEGHSRVEQADAMRHLAVHRIQIEGRYQEGLELGLGCRDLTPRDSPHQLMHATWPILAALFHLGRWEEMEPVLSEHVAAFAVEPAMECQFVRDGPVIGATVAALQDRQKRAVELAALVGDPLHDRATASAWQARYALISGDAATARAISEDKAVEGRTYGPQHALVLVEALTALRDWEALAAFLPKARASRAGSALLGPACDRAQARLRLEAGDTAAAIPLLRRARRRFRRLRTPLEEAATSELLALALPEGEAEAERSGAAAIFARLGARPAPAGQPPVTRIDTARGSTLSSAEAKG